MLNKVYSASGNKIASILIEEKSVKTLSRYYDSLDKFRAAFDKKISFDTKLEIKEENIRAIRNKDNSLQIIIDYKSKLGIVQGCEFEFLSQEDLNEFLIYFETQKHFSKSHKRKSPIKAASNSLAIFILVLGFYFLGINRLEAIATHTSYNANGKVRFFDNIVSMLGSTGLNVVCGVFGAVLLFLIFKHLSNPPKEIKLVPRNFVN